MKKTFNILKKLIVGLFLVLVLVAAGLLIFYEAIDKKTPFPAELNVADKINISSTIPPQPVLLPVPKKMEWLGGYYDLPKNISFSATGEDIETIQNIFKNRLDIAARLGSKVNIKLIKDEKLAPQAYKLLIEPHQIKIVYSHLEGLFYAMTTIKQLAKQTNNKIPCIEIEDSPDLQTRGAMLDISRGKIPTLNTLLGMVDLLADLKYNHLELYVEGFSFGYPTFQNLWEKSETPLMPEEIRQLDAYCKERYIDLVPNQNSLGHMQAWLATDQFKSLAECPDGYMFMGLVKMKTTLSPSNPESFALVKQMSEDLLPNFSSNKFNVNLDEPFELGKNKKHRIKDSKEVAKIYLDYATKLNNFVKSKRKKMAMWDDVVSKHPEFIPLIPKDITLLDWAYEDFQDFEDNCKKYKEAGLNYMVCPGTSSWTNFTGSTENMKGNVENAIENAIRYGAEGMLITDWGDTPHLQYLTVSYPGLTYGAALSWNYNSKSQIDLGNYLNQMVFDDKTRRIGNTILELGRYSQFEDYQMVSGSITGWGYRFGLMDKNMVNAIFKKFQNGIFDLMPLNSKTEKNLRDRFENPNTYNPKAIIDFVDGLEKVLINTKPTSFDSILVIDEYKNAIRMVKLGAMLKQYVNYSQQQTDDENMELLTNMKSLITIILPEHERLWMQRNKSGGYETSVKSIKTLQSQIDEKIETSNKNAVERWLNSISEKMKTAIAILYLRFS